MAHFLWLYDEPLQFVLNMIVLVIMAVLISRVKPKE